MKTYKQLSAFLNEQENIEEGRLANALAVGAVSLGLYGGLENPDIKAPVKQTTSSLVIKAPSSNIPKPNITTTPFNIKGKASGLGRLLGGLADKRKKKTKKKEPEPVKPSPSSHIRSEEEIEKPSTSIVQQAHPHDIDHLDATK